MFALLIGLAAVAVFQASRGQVQPLPWRCSSSAEQEGQFSFFCPPVIAGRERPQLRDLTAQDTSDGYGPSCCWLRDAPLYLAIWHFTVAGIA